MRVVRLADCRDLAVECKTLNRLVGGDIDETTNRLMTHGWVFMYLVMAEVFTLITR